MKMRDLFSWSSIIYGEFLAGLQNQSRWEKHKLKHGAKRVSYLNLPVAQIYTRNFGLLFTLTPYCLQSKVKRLTFFSVGLLDQSHFYARMVKSVYMI